MTKKENEIARENILVKEVSFFYLIENYFLVWKTYKLFENIKNKFVCCHLFTLGWGIQCQWFLDRC